MQGLYSTAVLQYCSVQYYCSTVQEGTVLQYYRTVLRCNVRCSMMQHHTALFNSVLTIPKLVPDNPKTGA